MTNAVQQNSCGRIFFVLGRGCGEGGGSVRVELSGKQFMNGTHQYDWKTTEIEMNHLCETSQL